MYNLEVAVKNITGFKISDSHFRIGSKIHIADFYYAKRFFQNGFFASRIAFLVAQDIASVIEKEKRLEDVKEKGLTLIGYEMYSELLISMVSIFLKKKWSVHEDIVNHNLFEDAENLRLCKKNNLLGNVFIIVPIASTFSTAIKIESQLQALQGKDKEFYIFQPHLNIIYVSDGIPDNQISELEKGFGWKVKDPGEKIVEVEAYYSDGIRKQKYYIALPTKWYLVDHCQLCSPEEGEKENVEKEELPLYETDRTAVTPAIILDYPRGRKIENTDLERKYLLDTRTVTYGHHVRNNTHYLYSIDTEYFFLKNIEAIKTWLLDIRQSPAFHEIYQDSDKVIIISSCHFSNASFVSLVNDYLFGGSANIIHYEPSNDYVQNFQIVYGEEMEHADKIFFVDDSLKSGTSFEKIYRFVQNSLMGSKKSDDQERGIAGCFFLVNKSQNSTFKNLKSRLIGKKYIQSFANLHLFVSLKPYENSLLLFEEARYHKLAEDSFLDSLKIHFRQQAYKLSVISPDREIPVNEQKAGKHIKMMIATHRIYQYFAVCGNNPQMSDFYEFYKDILAHTCSPDKEWDSKHFEKNEEINEDAKDYLKVLTQAPFSLYKPLKDYVFKWCIRLLKEHMVKVTTVIGDGTFNYAFFDSLKFYIRRVGLLNSNILMTQTFIKFLGNLYSEHGIPELAGRTKDIEKKRKLKNFHIFYIAQIKELLLRNESRCLRLERILKQVEIADNDYVNQIVRILREENALIIKMFYDHIAEHPDWRKNCNDNYTDSRQPIEFTNENIRRFVMQNSIAHHPKFQILNRFFDITNQKQVGENENFLNYLWIEYFLATDKYKTEISLNTKTEFIMKKLRHLFTNVGISTNGAFLIVNDSQHKKFVAYNRNANETNEIDEYTFNREDTDDDYIKAFFNVGQDTYDADDREQYCETIIELGRNNEGKWVNLFDASNCTPVNGLEEKFVSKSYNRLLLIRLNKRITERKKKKLPEDQDQTKQNLLTVNSKKKKEVQGILGFYYHKNDKDIVSIDVIRYLLLLRTSLSHFIERHHENDEFRDWQIANIRQKTSLLTGHGRQMLINIASNEDEPYREIVHTLLIVQRFIIDKQDESVINRDEQVVQMFGKFFRKEGQRKENDLLDTDFFHQIKQMAENIFKFEEIENTVDVDVKLLEVPENLSFGFSRNLFNMICFEILVNAKKNRWLFYPEEKITTDREGIYEKNRIWIKAKPNPDKNSLHVEIANTGPRVGDDVMIKINQKKNIKQYDKYSGIELLDTLLREFQLGEIRFSQEKIQGNFMKFMVKLELFNDNENMGDRKSDSTV